MKALLLAGGYGKRLGLKKKSKCMAKVNGKPILEHLVEHLKKAGITEIIIKVHHKPLKIMEYFGTRVLYYYETKLLDVEQSEKLLSDWLGDQYIVMNGDTLTNINIKKLMKLGSDRRYPTSVYFVKERYGGTKFVNTLTDREYDWDGDGAYYFDIGSKSRLAKARRLLKNG